MIRLLDLILASVGLVLGLPFFIFIFLIGLLDTGSPLFIQERVGRNKKPFKLVKFRTMSKETTSVASHLVSPASVTPLGRLLRKTKLDELPQLWNVLLGDMSMVGPRPNLFNQDELIQARNALGVYTVRPGITGLAQINKIDMSTPALLAETDKKMIDNLSVLSYFNYIFWTALGRGGGDRVKGD